MKNLVWTVVVILFAAGICSAQSTTLYYPQFVDGVSGTVGWITAIAVTNAAAPGTPVASGTITLTNDNGTPLNLTLLDDSGNPTPNTFQLAGGQTKFFLSPQESADRPLSFISGFASLTSNLPVTGGEIFIEFNALGNGAPIGTAGVPASTPLTHQEFFAIKDSDSNTGLAVANPGAGVATITFVLVDKFGNQLVAPATRTIAANNHTAFFVSELFPNAPSIVTGMLRITSDKAIVVVPLFFAGASFGAFPVIPLP